MPPLVITADRRDNGQTLAAVLKTHLGLSWTHVKRIIERRHVRVGGQIVADAAYRVKAGKRISIAAGVIEKPAPSSAAPSGATPSHPTSPKVASPKAASPKVASPKVASPKVASPKAATPKPVLPQERWSQPVEASPMASTGDDRILFVDAHVVVVNKPAGLTTVRHAEEAAEFGPGKRRYLPATLAELLPRWLGEPGRPVIAVHRLDRDTSGVLVFARTPQAAESLSRQFRRHTTDRRYFALVRGTPRPGRIESEFVRDRGDGRRGSSPLASAASRRAVTHVSVLHQFGNYALVECRLETGRTHQVRIHLGEAGTPLCGETVYDRPLHGQPYPDGSGVARPMLHAVRLGFDHPQTGLRMNWEVPPPPDFQALLQQFREQQSQWSGS